MPVFDEGWVSVRNILSMKDRRVAVVCVLETKLVAVLDGAGKGVA